MTSGTAPSDRDFDALCESALRIGREVKIGLCASLGLLTPERAARLREAGFRGFLMGEAFMKSGDPGRALAEFIARLKEARP